MNQTYKKKFATLNVVVDVETFLRITNGQQKVVFEYPERKREIEDWYAMSESFNLMLIVKVWCEQIVKGHRHASFRCDAIWDEDCGSWMGWLPEEKVYDEFDEPAGDHFVLYLGDRIEDQEEIESAIDAPARNCDVGTDGCTGSPKME